MCFWEISSKIEVDQRPAASQALRGSGNPRGIHTTVSVQELADAKWVSRNRGQQEQGEGRVELPSAARRR